MSDTTTIEIARAAWVDLQLRYEHQTKRIAELERELVAMTDERNELQLILDNHPYHEACDRRYAKYQAMIKERDEWKFKFEIADKVVKDYREAFGMKEGESGYDMMESYRWLGNQLSEMKKERDAAREDVRALTETLEIYADTANWESEAVFFYDGADGQEYEGRVETGIKTIWVGDTIDEDSGWQIAKDTLDRVEAKSKTP